MLQTTIKELLLVLLLSGCSRYSGMYLVSVQKRSVENTYVRTIHEADSTITTKTGLILPIDQMFGNRPYFDFKNDTLYLYVEKK